MLDQNLLTKALLEDNLAVAFNQSAKLIDSGRYFHFWSICFTVLIEYVHMFCPHGPSLVIQKFMEFNKIKKKKKKKKIYTKDVKHIVSQVLNILVQCCKKHISLYISPKYNVEHKSSFEELRSIFPKIRTTLKSIISEKKEPHSKVNKNLSSDLQYNLGRVLSIDCDSTHNFEEYVNIFTHSRSTIHHKIVSTLWKVLLKYAKTLGSKESENIRALKKIYDLNLLQLQDKQSLVFLNVCFYFLFTCDFDHPHIVDLNKKKLEMLMSDLNLKPDIKKDTFHMRKIYDLVDIPHIEHDIPHCDDSLLNHQIREKLFDFNTFVCSKTENRETFEEKFKTLELPYMHRRMTQYMISKE